MILKTHLISGAGNTFHICFDAALSFSQPPWTIENRKQAAKEICLKNKADGFIFLEPMGDAYRWHFYNNDGSDAEMCGNATRCIGYYVKHILKSEKTSWKLQTTAGVIEIQIVEKELFKIAMTAAQELKSNLGFYCDTGVPHLVLQVDSLLATDKLRQEAKKLRNHEEFFPRGTNVTYVVFENEKNHIQAISYERGVEDFTAACGTGAVAAALFNLTKRAAIETQVEMPGGTLMMNLSNLNRPIMIGPAVLLGSFEYEVTN